MLEWAWDNWPTIVAILALLERTGAMSTRYMKRVRLLMSVISRAHNLATNPDVVDAPPATPMAREMMPDAAQGDIILDSGLDLDEPKVNVGKGGELTPAPRVTRRRKLGRLLLDIIPVVSRLTDRRNGLDRTST